MIEIGTPFQNRSQLLIGQEAMDDWQHHHAFG